MTSRQARGQRAERAAQAMLERHGLTLIEANYRCRWGELDLVMLDGETLVVVEVRSRQSDRFMNPAESVGWRKQQKITRTIEYYQATRLRHAGRGVRIDVVAVNGDYECIDWITNAFGSEDDPWAQT